MHFAYQYPSISFLAERARRRIPVFAWEYLDSGTGAEHASARGRAALDAIRFAPAVFQGPFTPDTSTVLFQQRFAAPFGVSPVGMSGLIWPAAEQMLATMAAAKSIPYGLGILANETPEVIGPMTGGGGWFQIYPSNDADIQADLLRRAQASGFKTLILTVDVPAAGRRERQLRAGLTMPLRVNPRTLWRVANRPAWAFATLRHGAPRFRTLEPYAGKGSKNVRYRLVNTVSHGRPDWESLDRLRAAWSGNLVVKGILRAEDAARAAAAGVDAVTVSDHGGRQFDGAPTPIAALPAVVDGVGGKCAVLYDGGLRSGLDILRALALGADFCLLGRAFLFAVAALGEQGAAHAFDLLKSDLEINMIQTGARSIADLRQMKYLVDR